MPDTLDLSLVNAVRLPGAGLPSWARRPLDPDPEAVITLPGAAPQPITFETVDVTPAPVAPAPPPRTDSRKAPEEDNTLLYIGVAAAGIGLAAAIYFSSR